MVDKLTEIELSSIQSTDVRARSLTKDISFFMSQADDIECGNGSMHVIVQGDQTKPAILTYHDIGMNSTTCFQGFFSHADVQPILRHFCIYHLNAPGHHEGSLPVTQNMGFMGDPALIKSYVYPSMEQLADMVLTIVQYYQLKTFIGFGVGAGANVLARFAINNPSKVEALVLLNCTSGRAGWSEWAYQKRNIWSLKGGLLTAAVEEYMLWHWLGQKILDENHDLACSYSAYLRSVDPQNMGHFIQSFINRTDLGIFREMDPTLKEAAKTIKCPVLMVTGDSSPHLEDTITMNSRLDPAICTWTKFDCGGLIHEEVPDKLIEAFRLFLQGLGYIPSVRGQPSRSTTGSSTSVSITNSATSAASSGSIDGGSPALYQLPDYSDRQGLLQQYATC